MSARVTLDPAVWLEARFHFLAQRLQMDLFGVIGRCARLWAECTHREEYFLTEREIDFIVQHKGFANALVLENLAIRGSSQPAGKSSSRAGEVRSPYGGSTVSSQVAGDGTDYIYLKGTRGRIEWISGLRHNASKGGKARSQKGKRGANGRFEKEPASGLVKSAKTSPALSMYSIVNNNTEIAKSVPSTRQMSQAEFDRKKQKQLRDAEVLIREEQERKLKSARSDGPPHGATDSLSTSKEELHG